MRTINTNAFADENESVKTLLNYIDISYESFSLIQKQTIDYIKYIRNSKTSFIEGFIHEYSLSNEEGIAIMCLAESLLRIPDKAIAHAVINDKLGNKQWKQHISRDKSLFLNAASWGLLLVGKMVDLSAKDTILTNLFKKMGEPLLLAAVKNAIKYMSEQFILGHDLNSAFKNAKDFLKRGYLFSFDILGESSRTAEQADFYYKQYVQAIADIAKYNDVNITRNTEKHNLSIKLTALHPRVLYKKYETLQTELLPKLISLVELCREANISITFDAEESFRQDIYLKLLTDLITHKNFPDFEGIGIVVQAYQKRAFYILDYFIGLAKSIDKRLLVRLVKGAYWDSEIKFAQENGLEGYPVFTEKANTDVSYIACAKKMLMHNDLIYPQFATHNAHTIATIQHLAKNKEYEFQRLYGMGEVIHNKIRDEGFKSRIYAPIGQYEDLLAYLMRRLLENGANSSFINLVYNYDLSLNKLACNPIVIAQNLLNQAAKLPLPRNIWGESRENSIGYDLGFKEDYEEIIRQLAKFSSANYEAISIINGKQEIHDEKDYKIVLNPSYNTEEVGKIYFADKSQLKSALEYADSAFEEWSACNVKIRSEIVQKIGELLHQNRYELYSLLIKEAGKIIDDCIAEVREAIDFTRYYAYMSKNLCEQPLNLPNFTGEKNTLRWHSKGIFVCISPWNFPLSILVGQITAALVTGNTVVAKPAERASLIATFAVKLMHKAGIPKDVLQLLIASGKQIAENILTDDRVKGACFTGSTSTAKTINRILAMRDSAAIATLIAETGGQNCMIVDSSALLEQTADAVINSAFGSMGQRCSALRVLYIQEEIFEPLVQLIIGAMEQLEIGNPGDLSNDLGPLISHEAALELEAHINEITFRTNSRLISRYGKIKPVEGSFFVPHIIKISGIHDLEKENFGPVLHVISYKAKELDKVINEINSANFGLTFGIQSRIEEKIEYIANKVKVGNIYVNRTMIGAQVATHPFGGENNSGTGFKAGGPHYLMKFMTERALIVNTAAWGGNFELLK